MTTKQNKNDIVNMRGTIFFQVKHFGSYPSDIMVNSNMDAII